MDYDSDCDDPDPQNRGLSTPKKKRYARGGDLARKEKEKHRKQKFRFEWLKKEEFKTWLMPDKENNYKAYCRFCKVSFTSELTVIKNHKTSEKHSLIFASNTVKQNSITSFTIKNTPEEQNLQKLITKAEVKLAGFIAEHNIPFLASDHLSDLLKNIFTDSKIAKNIKIKRTKTTAIVTNVIGKYQKYELAKILQNTKFSLLTDESTDVGVIKTACVVVR